MTVTVPVRAVIFVCRASSVVVGRCAGMCQAQEKRKKGSESEGARE